MTQETFDFGNGPVPAQRHRNPDGSEGGWVAETASVAETVYVGKDAQIWDRARIWGNARIFDNVQISGYAKVSGNTLICGNAQILGKAWIFDNVRIWGDVQISGVALIFNNAQICGNVKISRTEQVLTLGPIGSENDILTVVFDEGGKIWCGRGCFWGTLAEFQAAVEQKPKGDKHREEYLNTIHYIESIRKFRQKVRFSPIGKTTFGNFWKRYFRFSTKS